MHGTTAAVGTTVTDPPLPSDTRRATTLHTRRTLVYPINTMEMSISIRYGDCSLVIELTGKIKRASTGNPEAIKL